MTTYLLDVNVLLALMDEDHIHAEVAHRWFGELDNKSWATCPITENGFVRIVSNPKYPSGARTVSDAVATLRGFCGKPGHHFWADGASICEIIRRGVVIPNSKITDAYLLGIAVLNAGKLATLDQKVPTAAIVGGQEALELLRPE